MLTTTAYPKQCSSCGVTERVHVDVQQPIDFVLSKCYVLHSGSLNWTYKHVARSSKSEKASEDVTVCPQKCTQVAQSTSTTHAHSGTPQQGNFVLLLNSLIVLAEYDKATDTYHEKRALPIGGMRQPTLYGGSDGLDVNIELFSTKKSFAADTTPRSPKSELQTTPRPESSAPSEDSTPSPPAEPTETAATIRKPIGM